MRLLGLFVLGALLVLVTWGVWAGRFDERFGWDGSVQLLRSAGAWGWLAGVLILASDLILPIPGTVVLFALGYVYGWWAGGVIGAVGLMAAGVCGYGVGRMCGEDTARKWLGEKDFENGRKMFQVGGGWAVAVSRALPILPEVISCMAGLVRMPFRVFVVSLACGSVPMGFLFAAIGAAGREAPGWAFGLSLVVPGVLWAAASRWKSRHIGP